jgi:2-iminobutanoate/2-iminopropanoate deaminase
VGAYSQGILTNEKTLYTSGQIALKSIEAGVTDIEKQTHEVCRNIAAVLKAAEMELGDVVKANCFLAEMDDFPAFNHVYEQYFAHRPARSTIAAKALPKAALVEIDVIAVKS